MRSYDLATPSVFGTAHISGTNCCISYSIYHSRLVSYTLIIVSFYQPSQPTSNPTDPDIVNPPSTPTPTNVSEYCFEIVIIYEALSSSTHLYIASVLHFYQRSQPVAHHSSQLASRPILYVDSCFMKKITHDFPLTNIFIHLHLIFILKSAFK